MSQLIYFVFFISGISGLIYQIVWVRQFGLLFGNTLHSAALVTGVFMLGLGLGSYIAGFYADKKFNKLGKGALIKYYGYIEFVIGGLGILLAYLLPTLAPLSQKLMSYHMSSSGFYEINISSYVTLYFLALALLLPVTILMGSTLTILIKHLVHFEIEMAGYKTGLLYGVNTLGAAGGCLLVDYIGIPILGLTSTQVFAALLNILAGFMALKYKAGVSDTKSRPASINLADADLKLQSSEHGISVGLVSTVAALGGMAGMGMEIIWFRFLNNALGQYRSVFSLLLFVILIGIWLGAFLGGVLDKKYKRPLTTLLIAQFLFALASLLTPLVFDLDRLHSKELLEFVLNSSSFLQSPLEVLILIFTVSQLVFVPALLMGATFPLCNSMVQANSQSLGKNSGLVYLFNTLGAFIGTQLAGFVIIPQLGMRQSFIFFACISVVSGLFLLSKSPILLKFASKKKYAPSIFATLAALLVLFWTWFTISDRDIILKSFRAKYNIQEFLTDQYLVDTSEGLLETTIVIDIPKDNRNRVLYTNGHSMTGNGDISQRYMRAFAHFPLLQMDNPKKVLLICFGVGNTANALAKYPNLQEIQIADLSKHVLSKAHFFEKTNGGVLNDPRVKVFVNDGRQHLRMIPQGELDLITLEPPPISFAGVSSLYSKEFYELAKSSLKDSGMISQWLPVRQLPANATLSLIKAMVDVFPNTVLLAGAHGEFILLGKKSGDNFLNIDRVKRNLESLPEVLEDLQAIKMDSLLDIAGSFLASSKHLGRLTQYHQALSDNYPISEYSKILFLKGQTPKQMIEPRSLFEWCPDCSETEELKELPRYVRLLKLIYTEDSFVNLGPKINPKRSTSFSLSQEDVDLIRSNDYLKSQFSIN